MASKKDLGSAAAAATSKLFSKAPVPKGAENAGREKKAGGSVFSFRSDPDKIKGWRLYAGIKQIPIGELGTAAIEEYIKKHPLEGAEKAFFESKIDL